MILSQRDPRWKNHPLGLSNLTIGGEGCTTTCIAMVNNDFGQNCTPDQVADHIEWYTRAGLILWPKLLLKGAVWTWREYGFNWDKIGKAVADPNQRVLIEVPMAHGSHWLKATRLDEMGHLLAYDPWFGDECSVIARYKKIIGSSFFTRRDPVLPERPLNHQ